MSDTYIEPQEQMKIIEALQLVAQKSKQYTNKKIEQIELIPGPEGPEGPMGPEGLAGKSGVYVGEDAPIDPEIEIWVDTKEQNLIDSQFVIDINSGVRVVDQNLTYSRGLVQVRKIGEILWIIDSGVYNFTESFSAKNSRTVLEFDLPKELSSRIPNTNGVYNTAGTVSYSPALAYENITYSTFNCQSYLKRSTIGVDKDTYQLVYTGVSSISGGGLCGFHSKMPVFLF